MKEFKQIFDNSKCNYSDNDIETIKIFLLESNIDVSDSTKVNDFHIEDSEDDMKEWIQEVAPNKEWIEKQKYCQLKDSNECLFFYNHPTNL